MHKDSFQNWISQRIPGSLLIGAGGIMGLAVLQQGWLYLTALFGILLLLLWPVQIALGGFACFVPFESISVPGSEGVSITFVVGSVALLILGGLGIVLRRLELPARPALYWLLFVLWAAASSVWAYDQKTALQRLPTMFSLYLFYVAATCFRLTEKEFSGIVKLTILGGCIAAVFSSYEFYSGISFHGLRSSLIVGTQAVDPNIFAASLLLPFSLAIGEFLAASTLVRKFMMLLSSGVIAMGMFLTMSRGALFAITVMLIVYMRKLRMSWRVLVPAVVLLAAFFLAPKLLVQRLEKSGTTGGAGRIYVWQTGLAALKDFGFVGAGLGNFPSIYDKYAGNAEQFVGLGRDPHNIYLETGVELGVIGLALLVMALASQLRMAKQMQPSLKGIPATLRVVACQAAAWGMLTASFFLGMLWFKAFWLVWIMLTLACGARTAERRVYPFQYPAFDSPVAVSR